MQKILDVHIGQLKIAKNGEVLKAILGSCVGIGIIWKSKGICGLAHCLLPESPNETPVIGARFVDQAIRSLISTMEIQPADLASISVIVVGGGNMTNPSKKNSELVGTKNFNEALKEAKKQGLKVVFAKGGGKMGRQIFLDSSNFSYRVEEIPRINSVA
jgi:chemotaxis protein CheD